MYGVTGEDHHQWAGGFSQSYGEGWIASRREALKRDEHECVNCGITSPQHKEETGQDLHVHHIEPVRTFEMKEDAHELDNLMTLCRDCHLDLEHSDETDPTALSV